MRRLLMFFALLLASALPFSAAAKDGEGPVRKVSWIWVELDAQGQVVGVEQDVGQNELVGGVLEAHARRLSFAPATIDGTAVSSGFPLVLTIDFVPVGEEGFRPDLLMAKVAPARGLNMAPPRYPRDAAIAGVGGFVRVEMLVTEDGIVPADSIAVTDSGCFRTSGRVRQQECDALIAATKQQASLWRFRNARIGDQVVSVRMSTPTTFNPPGVHAPRNQPDDFAVRAADTVPSVVIDARLQMPRLVNEFAPLPVVPGLEISASRVRRFGGE